MKTHSIQVVVCLQRWADSYVTLAFKDAEVIQHFSREETDDSNDTDDTDDTYDTDDTDDKYDTYDTDDTFLLLFHYFPTIFP